jgi:hypothetical protein
MFYLIFESFYTIISTKIQIPFNFYFIHQLLEGDTLFYTEGCDGTVQNKSKLIFLFEIPTGSERRFSQKYSRSSANCSKI